jgi:hypothetical protein
MSSAAPTPSRSASRTPSQVATHQTDVMGYFSLFGKVYDTYKQMHPHSLDPKANPFHRFQLDADEDEDEDERPKVQPIKKVEPKSLTLADLHPHVLLVFSLMNVRTDKISSAVALSESTVEFQFGSAVVRLRTLH